MSGIAVVFGPASPERHQTVRRMVSTMPERGDQLQVSSASDAAVLAACSATWQERTSGLAVGRFGDIAVVADATLYYRDDLLQKLHGRGVRPRSREPGDLIAAAVAAFGTSAPKHLEGDFAFVALHETSMEIVAARDFLGTRPLYFALVGGSLVGLSSSPRALLAVPGVSPRPNLAWLAELCSAMVSVSDETCYADVGQLPQGHILHWRLGDRSPRPVLYWECPHFEERGSSRLDYVEGAREVRRLLDVAVRERLDDAGPTTVLLSGGRDSPSIYACARAAAPDRVRSVSLSYPVGDIGREDEVIADILAACGGAEEAAWIDTETIPLMVDPLAEAGRRPSAFAHTFEAQQRALMRRARADGARVLMNGAGGDLLFHAEPTYLADLLFGGKWRTLAQEWRAHGAGWDLAAFGRWAVLPRLGPEWRAFITLLRGGRSVHDFLDPPFAPWIANSLIEGESLRDRKRHEDWLRTDAHGAADLERRMLILGPFAGVVFPEYARLALLEQTEQRFPLSDERLIRFAATRPRWERREGRDSKLLLRKAFADILPRSVLAARAFPTGLTSDYFRRRLDAELPEVVSSLRQNLVLSELGIIDAPLFRAAIAGLGSSTPDQDRLSLYFTTQVESWLERNVSTGLAQE